MAQQSIYCARIQNKNDIELVLLYARIFKFISGHHTKSWQFVITIEFG